jgi:hypothetical protein
MRSIFGIVGVLVVLVIVSMLAKKQLSAVGQLPQALPSMPGVAAPEVSAPNASVAEQSQALQQQVKQSVESSLEKAQQLREEKP